jgi:hypothetical protein
VPEPPDSPEAKDTIAKPHPLAERLIERFGADARGRILDFASGSGRNERALRAAGFTLVAIDDATAASKTPFAGVTGEFAAAISTHGLLHGTAATVAENLNSIAARLQPNGALYATFGSLHDARFGTGDRIDASTFAPADGDERGIPHVFFDRTQLLGLLDRKFIVESLDERGVDGIAGAWAHRDRPLRGAVHWFVVAQKR